jgi:tRNA threonylcarbamoyladenosine biosynthesis protein TsaB
VVGSRLLSGRPLARSQGPRGRGGAAGTVLGVDTATPAVAVALTREGEVVDESVSEPAPGSGPRHATELLAAIERAVAAGGGWPAVELIAAGTGPGLFTGLRVGIATVRALAQARGLPIAGVGSLAALARGIAVGDRLRLALIDARRGELFAALYDGDGTEVWEPFVDAPAAVGARLATLGETPVAAGDGSLRFRQEFEAAGVEVLPDADPGHRMAARNVCALAAEVDRVGPEELKPIYLRRPDADVWRQQQAGSGDRAAGR